MTDKISFEGNTYDLAKTTEEKAQVIRGLSRVIQKTQLELEDYGDKTLEAQTFSMLFTRH